MADADATTTATASSASASGQSTLTVPPDVAEKYGDLITLIKGSRSMDDSERQYWVDVLPIMSEDQISNLRGILDNEKKQLAAAEADYSDGMNKVVKNVEHEFDERAYEEKKRARQEAERLSEEEEKAKEAATLAELANL